jgi:hypothetical protein
MLALPLALLLMVEPLPGRQLTLDVDAASLAMTYAWGVRPGLRLGIGAGAGPSPLLGRFFTSNAHYRAQDHVTLLELLQLQTFVRAEPWPWLHLDAGLRGAFFVHGGGNFTGGPMLAAYVAPALRWWQVSAGPRVSAGVMSELADEGSAVLVIDYLIARFTFE